MVYGLKWYIAGVYGRQFAQIVFLLPLVAIVFLLCIRASVTRNPKPPFNFLNYERKLHIVLFSFYCVIVCVGLLRATGLNQELTIVNTVGRIFTTVIIILFACFADDIFRDSGVSIWKTVTTGLSVYMFMNIGGILLGITPEFITGLRIDVVADDAIFSLWEYRLLFPFTSTPGMFSIEIGIFAVLLFVYLPAIKGKNRAALIILIFSALVVIGAGNARSTFAFLACAILAQHMVERIEKKTYYVLFLIVVFVPLIVAYIKIADVLSLIPYDLSFLTRRGDPAELFTFNNRAPIWRYAFDELQYIKLVHFVGYGSFGRIASGISYYYAKPWQNPETISLHNGYIEMLFDTGYLGLAIFLFLIVNAIRELTSRRKLKSNTDDCYIAKPILIFLILSNLLSPIIYINNNLIFFIFVLVNLEVIRGNSYGISMSRFHRKLGAARMFFKKRNF